MLLVRFHLASALSYARQLRLGVFRSPFFWHLTGEDSPDWLFTAEGEQRFVAQRVATRNTHGTGCTLSAALAALRPRYGHWGETVAVAKHYLQCALEQADTLEVGQGVGPVHHFHQWW